MADADLVLEGGGVTGSGRAGALFALAGAADLDTFHRIAGTSAGAIAASVLAAGYTVEELGSIITEHDFAQFEDESPAFTHFKLLGEGFGLLFGDRMFRGDFLHSWIADTLAKKTIRTWADLKDPDREVRCRLNSSTSLS